MGLRDRFSNYKLKKAEERGLLDDLIGRSVKFGGYYVDEDVLQSSDVYELVQDISNQILLAQWTVEDDQGNEIKNHHILETLRKPNSYLTKSEFLKLLTNTYLLEGEVFPVYDGRQIHLASNVYTELDDYAIEHFKVNDNEIPQVMIRHIKNMGVNHLRGVGLKELGRNTLEGVMNAEKVLTDKYKKGGLLAFLLKLGAQINPQNAQQSKLTKAILNQLESIDDSRTVKLITLGQGYEISTLTSPVEDEKILSFLDVYKKDLGKFLGINVDTYQSLMESDIEKAMMYLHNKAIRPILQLFEEHLTLLFFGQNSKLRLKAKINILDFVQYSTKTNIAYNLVRTMIATPDDSREMLGFKKLNTEESSKLYISKDLIAGQDLSNATDNSLKGGDNDGKQKGNTDI